MFERLFAFIRESLKNAIVGAVDDAQDEINQRIESSVDHTKRLNGTAVKPKKKASK